MNTSSQTTLEQLPTFGLIGIEPTLIDYADDGDTPVYRGFGGCLGQHDHDTLDDLSAETLRQLAADALAAAEWLEAQR